MNSKETRSEKVMGSTIRFVILMAVMLATETFPKPKPVVGDGTRSCDLENRFFPFPLLSKHWCRVACPLHNFEEGKKKKNMLNIPSGTLIVTP